MENPRIVGAFGKGILVASGILLATASVYWQTSTPVVTWIYFIALLAVAFVAIFLVWSVTIWPLVLLIAKIFTRKRGGGRATGKSMR